MEWNGSESEATDLGWDFWPSQLLGVAPCRLPQVWGALGELTLGCILKIVIAKGGGGGRTIFICNYFFWGGGGKVLIHHSFFVLIVRDVLFFKQELKQHFNFHCENYWFFLSPLNRKALDTREASFTESLVILWSKVILFTHSNLSLITLPVCQVEYVWCLNDKYLFSFIGGDFTNGDGTGGMEFLHSVNGKFRT